MSGTATLIERLATEADQCRNDGADDIAKLLDEAVTELQSLGVQAYAGEVGQARLAAELGTIQAASDAAWIPITPNTMPQSGSKVQVAVARGESRSYARVLLAQYIADKTEEARDEDDASTYDEASDTYYVDAGWYEYQEGADKLYAITDPVVGWQPRAPLPSGITS